MKRKMILILCVLSLLTINGYGEEKEVKQQRFKVIFKIQYNAITLEKAAELEKLIKQFSKDACSVEIEVDKEDQTVSYSNGTIEWEVPQDWYILTPSTDGAITVDPCGGNGK